MAFSLSTHRNCLFAAMVPIAMMGAVSVAGSQEIESASSSAAIEVAIPFAITEVQALDFGVYLRPTFGSSTYRLHWNENSQVSVVDDTGGGAYVGEAQRGVYRARAPRDNPGQWQSFQISAYIEPFDAQGITINAVHLNGETNSASATLNPSGWFDAHVGGVVTLDADATPGVHTATVHIIAISE